MCKEDKKVDCYFLLSRGGAFQIVHTLLPGQWIFFLSDMALTMQIPGKFNISKRSHGSILHGRKQQKSTVQR
jgi:hypothetical protein